MAIQSLLFFRIITEICHCGGFSNNPRQKIFDFRGNPVYNFGMNTKKQYYVYILFNKRNGTLYVGVTSDIIKRIWEHKNKVVKGFTEKYGVDKLGYYEMVEDINVAIEREKQLKAGKRKTKLDLIESINPTWRDLYEDII